MKNMNKRNLLFILFLCVLIISVFLSNGYRKNSEQVLRVQLIDQISLLVNGKSAFSDVNDMLIDKDGNFIIVDSYQTRGIYVFNKRGDFIKKIGRMGQGSGEHTEPTSIAINPKGQLLVCDYMNNRINVFNSDYTFYKSIIIQGRIKRHIFAPTISEIIMYNGMAPPLGNKIHDTIVKYNKEGKKIASFAPLQHEVLKTHFCSARNGVSFDKFINIYEINPLFYQIRKYDIDGNLIKECLPNSNKFYLNNNNNDQDPILINGPFVVGEKYIIVQIENSIDIFDLNLIQIVKELPFKEKIVCTDKNKFYTFSWSDKSQKLDEYRPVVRCYTLVSIKSKTKYKQ